MKEEDAAVVPKVVCIKCPNRRTVVIKKYIYSILLLYANELYKVQEADTFELKVTTSLTHYKPIPRHIN